MNAETPTKEKPEQKTEQKAEQQTASSESPSPKRRGDDSARGRRGRGGRSQSHDEGDGLLDRLVSVNRVAKVVKGGRRFGFAALVVVGDGNGMVGHGNGKAKEISEAIRKATEKAKHMMMRVPLRQGRTLHYDMKGRYGAGKVVLRAAPPGTGIIAGGPMRAIFEVLGVEDVVTKSIGTSNPHNMIRATFAAFRSVRAPRMIAAKRGITMKELAARRDDLMKTKNSVHKEEKKKAETSSAKKTPKSSKTAKQS